MKLAKLISIVLITKSCVLYFDTAQVSYGASLGEIALSGFPSTLPNDQIPNEFKPVSLFKEEKITLQSPIYFVVYLSDQLLDEYGERQEADPLPIIYKFNKNGYTEWMHIPRIINQPLRGQVNISNTSTGISYLHPKSGYLVQLDSNGNIENSGITKNNKNQKLVQNIFENWDGYYFNFIKVKKFRLITKADKLTSGMNINILKATNLKTKSSIEVFNPLKHLKVWKHIEKRRDPYKISEFSCHKGRQLRCLMITKNPHEIFQLTIKRKNFFKGLDNSIQKINLPETISETIYKTNKEIIAITLEDGRQKIQLFKKRTLIKTIYEFKDNHSKNRSLALHNNILTWREFNSDEMYSLVLFNLHTNTIISRVPYNLGINLFNSRRRIDERKIFSSVSLGYEKI
ncbi:MAG: hypothetical protein R3B45_12400 [Bdellovibrionota bacterium]